jgi:hypothetical protein
VPAACFQRLFCALLDSREMLDREAPHVLRRGIRLLLTPREIDVRVRIRRPQRPEHNVPRSTNPTPIATDTTRTSAAIACVWSMKCTPLAANNSAIR